MAELGTTSLIIALALAAYSTVTSFAGVRRKQHAMVISGMRANYLTSLVLGVAVLALMVAFLQSDFSIRYVAEHSNLAMPHIYTWVAFYAGNEGSLLYVAFALAGMAALADCVPIDASSIVEVADFAPLAILGGDLDGQGAAQENPLDGIFRARPGPQVDLIGAERGEPGQGRAGLGYRHARDHDDKQQDQGGGETGDGHGQWLSWSGRSGL